VFMIWLLIVACLASILGVTTLLVAYVRPLATTSLAGGVQALEGRQERRSLLRMKISRRGTLAGIGGQLQDLPVRCANISDYGALVLAKQALQPGCDVILNIPSLMLVGVGRVRHCRRRFLRYAAGIEFNGPLRRAESGDWTFTQQRSSS